MCRREEKLGCELGREGGENKLKNSSYAFLIKYFSFFGFLHVVDGFEFQGTPAR